MYKILFALLFVLSFTSQASALNYVEQPLVQDAYVLSSNPNTNYSSNATLYMQGGEGRNGYTYVTVPTASGLPENMTEPEQVLIRFYVANAGTSEISLYSTTNFTAATLTWNNKPAVGELWYKNSAYLEGWVQFDVTRAYNAGHRNFVLLSNNQDGTTYRSMHTANPTQVPYVVFGV